MVWNVCCALVPAHGSNGCVKSTPNIWSTRASSPTRWQRQPDAATDATARPPSGADSATAQPSASQLRGAGAQLAAAGSGQLAQPAEGVVPALADSTAQAAVAPPADATEEPAQPELPEPQVGAPIRVKVHTTEVEHMVELEDLVANNGMAQQAKGKTEIAIPPAVHLIFINVSSHFRRMLCSMS